MKYAHASIRRPFALLEKIGLEKTRLQDEVKAISIINELVGTEFADHITAVLFSSKKDGVIILSDIQRGGLELRKVLLGSNVPIPPLMKMIRDIGRFMGLQHSQRCGKGTSIRSNREDFLFFQRLMRFRTVDSCRLLSSSLKSKVRRTAQRILEEKDGWAIINGDFTPKQVFVDIAQNEWGVCDFEFATLGDPAYDIGFFIANIKILEIVNPSSRQAIEDLIHAFKDSYFSTLRKDKKMTQQLIETMQGRINFYIATGMLNRIDGVPWEGLIPIEKVPVIRQAAIQIVG